MDKNKGKPSFKEGENKSFENSCLGMLTACSAFTRGEKETTDFDAFNFSNLLLA